MRRRGQGRHLQRRRTQPPRVEHWATRSFFKASRSVRRGAGTLVGAPVAERRTRGSCGLCGTRSRNSRFRRAARPWRPVETRLVTSGAGLQGLRQALCREPSSAPWRLRVSTARARRACARQSLPLACYLSHRSSTRSHVGSSAFGTDFQFAQAQDGH